MDPTLAVALATAAGAIVVAVVTTRGQQRVALAAAKAAETQAELDTTKMVVQGWKDLVDPLVAEVKRARAEAQGLRDELEECRASKDKE